MSIDDFTTACPCPSCGEWGVHLIEEASPDPPRLVEAERIEMFGRPGAARVIYAYSHQDERDWSVARVCQCGHRWGQR